jgi:hypothetical protein
MAKKTRLEFDFDFSEIETVLKSTGKAINANVARQVGKTVVTTMKRQIDSGISPITGSGISRRFEGYRNSYRDRISKGGFPGKGLRPVNLKLTGDFLRNLKFRVESRDGTTTTRVGFFDAASVDKELGHRTGANNQAKRPIIPTVQEKFNAAIVDEIESIYEDAIEKYLNENLE